MLDFSFHKFPEKTPPSKWWQGVKNPSKVGRVAFSISAYYIANASPPETGRECVNAAHVRF